MVKNSFEKKSVCAVIGSVWMQYSVIEQCGYFCTMFPQQSEIVLFTRIRKRKFIKNGMMI